MIQPDDVVLFQGDSITDHGRERDSTATNAPESFGGGYVRIAAGAFLADHPDKNLRVFNRGVSGNTVGQMEDRWQEDCLDLKPTLLSVLIGINDTARWVNKTPEGRPPKEYEVAYRRVLDAARKQNNGLRVVICEPFGLRAGHVTDDWLPGLNERREMARKIAEDYGAIWVPFQRLFDEALKEAPVEYWLPDGVHPTLAGHQRMARMWIETVGNG